MPGSENRGKYNLSLDNMKNLLRKLGNPERDLDCIHVAGTNGKGSVCAILSSILEEAGYRVGKYISPHLKDFRERVMINGKKISKEDVVNYFNKVSRHSKDNTFFEIITAMAFLYFRDKKVDFLVLEVGLGGRLDATNVVNPLVSVITNIGLEHTTYLGDTIEQIAYEKAGIIKKKKPVITGARGRALGVIRRVAKEKGSKVFLIEKPLRRNHMFDLYGYRKLKLQMKGEFQLENSSIAVRTIDVLNKYYGLSITENNVRIGLYKTMVPGRFDFLERNIILDCAHNPDAIRVLKREISKLKYRRLLVVIGILSDKDYGKMLSELEPITYRFIFTKAKIPRSLNPSLLSKVVRKDFVIIEEPKNALRYAKRIALKKDLILVTGSVYVVREIIKSKRIKMNYKIL